MTASCRYHCRACAGHFASLEAFDAHRGGPPAERTCSYPDAADLVEIAGACKIASVEPISGVTIYGTARAERVREHFGGTNGRETAPAERRRAILA